MWDRDEKVGHREKTIMLRDLDGSLSGQPNVALVKWDAYYTEGLDCEIIPKWNFKSCNEKFVRVRRIQTLFILQKQNVMILCRPTSNPRSGTARTVRSSLTPLWMKAPWSQHTTLTFSTQLLLVKRRFSTGLPQCQTCFKSS